MQPMGQQQIIQEAMAGNPDAIETAKMMGIQLPPPPPPAPLGPQSTKYMGPMGGGLVPPGRPQGLSAGDPTTVPNNQPMLDRMINALRGGGR